MFVEFNGMFAYSHKTHISLASAQPIADSKSGVLCKQLLKQKLLPVKASHFTQGLDTHSRHVPHHCIYSNPQSKARQHPKGRTHQRTLIPRAAL